VAVFVSAIVAMLAFGAPAVAGPPPSWVLTDNFESNAAATWFFGGNPACGFCGYISDDSLQAHSGTHWASIDSFYNDSFFSVGRTVHLQPPAGFRAACYAQVYVKLPAGQLNFEVIDPTTWTYIALTTIQTTSDVGYRLVTAGTWYPGPLDVVIRVSVVRVGDPPTDAFANVDDLRVVCT
jgi:hypothetical protein